MKPSLKLIHIVLVVMLAFSLAGCSLLPNRTQGLLQASGVIEATEIVVAPELSGRVAEINLKEGDTVRAGDALLRLDASLLASQRQISAAAVEAARAGVRTAQAGLDAARAQYNQVLSASLAAEQPDRRMTWTEAKPGEFDLPGWYYSKDERLSSTDVEVRAAKQSLAQAQDRLAAVKARAGSAEFMQSEERLADARITFLIAQEVLDRTSGISDGQELRDAAQDALDDAQSELEDAQEAYDEALSTDGAGDVLQGRAEVNVAQERYASALDVLRQLQTGPYSLEVAAAAKTVDQASALLEQSKAAVVLAEAELAALDTQLEKLTVRAPADGVILTRSIQPGEVLQAGLAVLTIGKLDALSITVYLPEDLYGEIGLGDEARVSVDSFPGQTFAATITRIADKAEYTPRNIQTKEERQTTVYAIQLTVDDPDRKLIPGMPADVVFQQIASP